ncbi:YgjV family protein [Desulfoluna sp.]|uniref:YgjV family protein n=1 Tax=Desulfoluna sp. TaxID=2045199 RepID=UPI00262F71D1|nr:YgjV family protein [Desulfoluna sp.]
MSPFLLSQILIACAICSDLLSFQFKERKKIVACLSCSCTLISAHFVLLGQTTAAILLAIATLRFFTSIFTTSKKTMGLFAFVTLMSTALTYGGLLSLLSCAGSLLQTTAAFCQEDKRLRELILVGTGFWICHNLLAHSPMAVIMEMLFMTSNIVGYCRYYRQPVGQEAGLDTRRTTDGRPSQMKVCDSLTES